MEIKTVLITQARTGSTRLPGKVLMEVNQTPLLKIHLDRLKKSKRVNKIIVATTNNVEDDIIEKLSMKWGHEVFRGSENDVLDRFYQAVKNINPSWVVRITSDCPLIDPKLIDEVIEYSQINNIDYCSNTLVENFPDGQDVEVFRFSVLEYAWENALKKSDREHVTPFIRKNCDYMGGKMFKSMNYPCEFDFNAVRITVDEQRDFDLIQYIIKQLGRDKSWKEYVDYIIQNDLTKINDKIIRNKGYIKSLKNDING